MKIIGSLEYNEPIFHDKDWLIKYEAVKKDPYRYVLSKKEENKCYHRIKRFLFVFGLPSLYVYKHLRYHQELSRLAKLKFTSIQLLEIVPRVAVSVLVLYPISHAFFVDSDRLKLHQIAKYELQKFDPNWFTYDDYKYTLDKPHVYNDADSVWGRIYVKRLLYDYFQTAGWIKRRRDANPNIVTEVPPSYDFTPKGPREGTDFAKMENEPLPFLVQSKMV